VTPENAPVSPPTTGRILQQQPVACRSRVTNHNALLPGVDGRSKAARRFRDIVAALVADQGGLDRCSEARLQLIRRFAAAAVMSEQMETRIAAGESIDVGEYSQLSSTMVRCASRIGIDRRARNVTPALRDYIEGVARRHDDGQDDD
jgi:hypothetical protein